MHNWPKTTSPQKLNTFKLKEKGGDSEFRVLPCRLPSPAPSPFGSLHLLAAHADLLQTCIQRQFLSGRLGWHPAAHAGHRCSASIMILACQTPDSKKKKVQDILPRFFNKCTVHSRSWVDVFISDMAKQCGGWMATRCTHKRQIKMQRQVLLPSAVHLEERQTVSQSVS